MKYAKRKPAVRRKSTKSSNIAFYNKKYSALELAKKALAGLAYVKGMINCEKHKMEFSDVSGPNISNTGTIYHLTGVGQDDTDSGRTGNSLLARGLYFSYTIRNSTSSPLAVTTVRVMLIQDQQQISDTGPGSVTGILEYASGPRVVNSALDSSTVGRWNILYDKRHELDTINNPQDMVSTYIKLRTHLRYNGAGPGDIQKHGIYAVFLSSDAAGTSNPIIYQMQSRLYFYDN